MKIYQVHKSGGKWEDAYDYIVKSCLNKEKAENYKKQYEEEFAKSTKNSKICDLCPFCTGREGVMHAKELTSYCKRVNNDDFVIRNEEVIECKKYEYVYDEEYYEIEEVDVEE